MDRAVGKLQTLVRIPTVSYRDPEQVDTDAFDGFVEALREQFPRLHEHLELTRIHTPAKTQGLLFHWRGVRTDRPVVLMAHLDVLPVEGEWQHAAFGGDIADGQLWGRGTLGVIGVTEKGVTCRRRCSSCSGAWPDRRRCHCGRCWRTPAGSARC